MKFRKQNRRYTVLHTLVFQNLSMFEFSAFHSQVIWKLETYTGHASICKLSHLLVSNETTEEWSITIYFTCILVVFLIDISRLYFKSCSAFFLQLIKQHIVYKQFNISRYTILRLGDLRFSNHPP